jgi:hypothetical protein
MNLSELTIRIKRLERLFLRFRLETKRIAKGEIVITGAAKSLPDQPPAKHIATPRHRNLDLTYSHIGI